MDRRRFLSLAGYASLAAAVRIPFSAAVAGAAAAKPVAFGGLLYKCDGTGKIYVSATNGKSWALQTNLGPTVAVSALAVDKSGHLGATVGYKGRSFGLTLGSDKHAWLTT